MTVIGIKGYANSGKDTIAEFLVEEHGYVQMAFADGVRALAHRLDPVVHANDNGAALFLKDVVDVKGWEWAKEHTNAREFLVNLGAGAREIINPYVWVDILRERVMELPTAVNVVISDVRYANEARMIRGLGGRIWEVRREGVGPANDEEERSMGEFYPDLLFLNNSDIDHLLAQVGVAASILGNES